jgi:hypothetical protein
MFHRLDEFEKLMGKDRLGFLYARWQNHPACLFRGEWSSQRVYGDGDEERTLIKQLKVINFGMMWGARGRLENLIKAAHGIDAAVVDAVGKLDAAWNSKASVAAVNKISEMKAATADYSASLAQLMAHIDGARNVTYQAIDKFANFTDDSDISGKPIMDRYSSLGGDGDNGKRGDLSAEMDEMAKALTNGTYIYDVVSNNEVCRDGFGGEKKMHTPESLHAPGEVYLTSRDNRWSDQACRELNEICTCYYLTVKNFRAKIKATVDAVNQAWAGLQECGNGNLDPFGKLTLSQQSTDPGDGRPGTDDRPGNGRGRGKSDPGQQVPPIPPMPPLATPGDLNADGKPDNPGDLNMDGKPDNLNDLDGDGKPDSPLAGQVDADGDGKPDSLIKDKGTPETVKITEGDRTIEVASPDGQGHVKVSVDDGSGTPKTYDLDFAAASALADGSTGMGTDGRPVAVGPDGQPVASFGPDGQPVAAVGPDGRPMSPDAAAEHVQAGADGKAVIHDGPLTITAERPAGSPDSVVVTLDDGSGKPTTYTMDFADTATGGAQPLAASSSAAASGGPADLGSSSAGVSGGPGDSGPVSAAVSGGPADSGPQPGVPAAAEQGSTFAASDAGGSHAWGASGSVLDGEVADLSSTDSSAGSGEAGISSAQSGPSADPAGQPAGAMGGGMMGGGMGGGGGGGGSGDQERAGSQWRTTGNLFDDDYLGAEASLSSTIDGGN